MRAVAAEAVPRRTSEAPIAGAASWWPRRVSRSRTMRRTLGGGVLQPSSPRQASYQGTL